MTIKLYGYDRDFTNDISSINHTAITDTNSSNMGLIGQKIYMIDKSTGEAKALGEITNTATIQSHSHSNRIRLAAMTGQYQFALRYQMDKEDIEWILDRPNRIRKYIKQIFEFQQKIRNKN